MTESEILQREPNQEEFEHSQNTILDDPELEQALESVPPQERKVIERMMVSSFQMRGLSSPETAVMKKITEEHITKYLEGAEIEMKNSYTEKFHKKVFTFLTIVVAMIFFVIIILLLEDKPEIMEKIIYTLGGVIAGAFGGYGFGKKQNDD